MFQRGDRITLETPKHAGMKGRGGVVNGMRGDYVRVVWDGTITQQEVELWRVRREMEPIMQFFAYAHLPEHLQAVSAPFGQLAEKIVETLPRNPERTVALRKLLEAKDAAVRALVAK